MRSKLIKVSVLCLLFILVAQAIISMRKKSVTVDEIMYATTGYHHLKTGEFQNIFHPPLVKVISALPLLALDLHLPSTEKYSNDDILQLWKYSRSFLYENDVDADTILFLARLPIILISIILGLYIFWWSKELYGEKAGLFALFLYSFSPNILANSRLVTHDLALAAFLLISTYYFWKFVQCPGGTYLILCGFFFGLALLTKIVALFLIPILAVYALVCILRQNGLGIYGRLPFVRRINQRKIRLQQFSSLTFFVLVIGLSALIMLNIGYGFQGSFKPINKKYHSPLYLRLPLKNIVCKKLSDLLLEAPLPIPSPYLDMFIDQYRRARSSPTKNAFFAGRIHSKGLWYLMPMVFLLKTPIPLLVLLGISTFHLIWRQESVESEWLMLIFAATFMFIFSYSRTFNAPLRYILPIYPFIYLLTSRLLVVKFERPKLKGSLLLALAAWYVLGTLSIHPHYLAYFNEIIGGPKNGYKYLVDSNLDWGQDLKGLKQYMEENGIEKIKLAYFGSADASYYGIAYDYLPSSGLAPKEPGQYWWYEMDSDRKKQLAPQKGIIAVSATILASPGWMNKLFHSTYEWLRQHEPIDNVGYSILIYNIE